LPAEHSAWSSQIPFSLTKGEVTASACCCVQVEDLVLGELEKLQKGGFSSTAVEAALNSIEFDLRENNTGSFPRGLSLMLRSMSSWIYDKDPFQPLQWTDSLEHFKVLSSLLFILWYSQLLLPFTSQGLPYQHLNYYPAFCS